MDLQSKSRYCRVDTGECMDKNGHGTDLWSRMQKSRPPGLECSELHAIPMPEIQLYSSC